MTNADVNGEEVSGKQQTGVHLGNKHDRNKKVNYKKDEYQCPHCWEGNQPVPPTFWFAQPTLTASDKNMRM